MLPFTSTSTGNINSYEWDFDDKFDILAGYGKTVTHTYLTANDHNVTLKVKDDKN